MMKKLLSLFLAAVLLCSLGAAGAEVSALYVKQVENLPEDFFFGMDVSSLLSEEASGVKYYGFDGQESDLMKILSDAGINLIRVRVWNHPFDAQGRGYGGGNCDASAAAQIGRRAAQYGMGLLVDFHYSDFWADPGKQMVPLAWRDLSLEEKAAALYQFTLDSLKEIQAAGANISLVQIGNETNGWLCGEREWSAIARLMNEGARAVRETCPGALVAVHFANPENAGNYASYAANLSKFKVDYDVFATSYYPYWHGTLDNLSRVLNRVADNYGKKTLVAETSWAFTTEDTDFSGNTIGPDTPVDKPYPYTVQGQANCVREITDTMVNRARNGIGVVYWEGAWITVGGASREENSRLWEQYGSGWASSFASAYDPDDAGKYYGGSAVDNQAFFDATGHPLASLNVFRLMGTGCDAPVVPDALEDAAITCGMTEALSLPETVNAIMTDNSRQALPVEWRLSESQEKAMRAAPGTYTVTGQADGEEARCLVTMVEMNYLTDPDFEEGGQDWEITDLNQADQLYIEDKKNDSLSGTKHMHFWSARQDSVEFTLEQQAKDLPEGRYRFSISIMGGDGGNTDIYAYVKKNGEIIEKVPMKITSDGNWDTGVIPEFSYAAGDEISVGVYVKCQGAGNGAWGKIDGAQLTYLEK